MANDRAGAVVVVDPVVHEAAIGAVVAGIGDRLIGPVVVGRTVARERLAEHERQA